MNASQKEKLAPWLLLVFSLPTAKASERVGVWRKLQTYGALALPASGYVLPSSSINQERFEWLATSIRGSKGQAAVAQVCSFDEFRNEQIEHMFNEARTREYQVLEKELKIAAKLTQGDKSKASISRLKRRLQQIVAIDFYGSPIRARIEEAVRQLESDDGADKSRAGKKSPKDYVGRTWITRPQPGIDRVSASGGNVVAITTADPAKEFLHVLPQFLPDQRHFLFHALSTTSQETTLYAGSLDSKTVTRVRSNHPTGLVTGQPVAFTAAVWADLGPRRDPQLFVPVGHGRRYGSRSVSLIAPSRFTKVATTSRVPAFAVNRTSQSRAM